MLSTVFVSVEELCVRLFTFSQYTAESQDKHSTADRRGTTSKTGTTANVNHGASGWF